MPNYQVPVKANVPATGTVEIEADSFEEACTKVQADLDANGFESLAANVEFTSDWRNQSDLGIDEQRARTAAEQQNQLLPG